MVQIKLFVSLQCNKHDNMRTKQVKPLMVDFINDALKSEHTHDLYVGYVTESMVRDTKGVLKLGEVWCVTFINWKYKYHVERDRKKCEAIVTRYDINTNTVDDSYTFKCNLKRH